MVIWADPAKADLHHIYEFIAEDSKQYARKVTLEMVEKTDILYEIKPQNIEVLAVIHKRRDFRDIADMRDIATSRISTSRTRIFFLAARLKL